MKNRDRRSVRSLNELLHRLKLLFRRKPDDPYAYRMAPLRRPPHRGGAAAVAELDKD